MLCHSQTLCDSCCSLICLVHGQLKDPSNLVLKLIIIALILNNWSPFQFSKCWNIRVKTLTIDWCNHNGARTSDFGLLLKDRSRVQSRLITRSTCQFAYPKVPTTTGFYAIAYPRVKNHILTCKWQYMWWVISFINYNQRYSRKRSLKNKAVTWLEHLLLRITSWLILSTKII